MLKNVCKKNWVHVMDDDTACDLSVGVSEVTPVVPARFSVPCYLPFFFLLSEYVRHT